MFEEEYILDFPVVVEESHDSNYHLEKSSDFVSKPDYENSFDWLLFDPPVVEENNHHCDSQQENNNNENKKHPTKNALACKKFRERRKQEINELKRRNETLEAEQGLFLSKIARLETQVQSLRNVGIFDLEKENRLLKNQLEIHKTFIYKLSNVAHLAPPSMSREEEYSLLRKEFDFQISQLGGLMYSSALSNTNWKSAKDFVTLGVRVKIKYQFLPVGCKQEDSKRINVRYDFLDIPIELNQAREKLEQVYFDHNVDNEAHEIIEEFDKCTRKTKEIFPDGLQTIRDELSQKEENMKLYHYSEEKEELNHKMETIYSCCKKEGHTMNGNAFLHGDFGSQKEIETCMITSHTTPLNFLKEDYKTTPDLRDFCGSILYPSFSKKKNKAACCSTFIGSFSLENNLGFLGEKELIDFMQRECFVNEKTNIVNKHVQKDLTDSVGLMLLGNKKQFRKAIVKQIVQDIKSIF